MSNSWLQFIKKHLGAKQEEVPKVLSRSKHRVSRSSISQSTLKVLYRLKDAGFSAYLVGGGVRDILLGRSPKDFDVATDAHPEQIRNIFKNSRIIGRRFRLVHVYYQDEVIEVSTFRSNDTEDTRTEVHEETGMIYRDNTYGTIEEDAWRRDFTVNALYYNIADFSVVDYTNGLKDLKQRHIRVIGDPTQRFHEDPVRMLRAIRLSAKLGFTIESASLEAVLALPHLLQHVSSSRLFDEVQKLFFEGNAKVTYQALEKYNYLSVLFPETVGVLTHQENKLDQRLINLAIEETDTRIASGKTVNPGFLLAVMLWPVLQHELNKTHYQKNKFFMRLHHVIAKVINDQLKIIMIPKRFQATIQSIWLLQFYLQMRRPKRVMHTFTHRYFRAAFDFMSLRMKSGEKLHEACDWWQVFQVGSSKKQQSMIDDLRSMKQ